MDISDNVVVLDYGKIIADGPPDEVRANQEVIDAYLGVSMTEVLFFIEVVVAGLLAGTMYSLVAWALFLYTKLLQHLTLHKEQWYFLQSWHS